MRIGGIAANLTAALACGLALSACALAPQPLEPEQLQVISEDELFLIQKFWKAARQPDDGGGVGRIVTRQKGIVMSDWKETSRLRELQEEVASEKGIRADTLRRLLETVEQYSESHRAFGLPDKLLDILKDDLSQRSRQESRVS